MKKLHYLFIVIFALGTSLTSCKKDKSPDNNALSLEINQFIWYGLRDYYLWVDSVPKLSAAYFQNSEVNLNAFLKPYIDHEKLFNDLLYKYEIVDRFSWIVDNYEELENSLQGISKSMGYDFRLVEFGSSGNIFGFVRYVVKGSPADIAGMKRGDIFIKVNDQQLTVSNYQTLLINSDSYKLSFADIVDMTIIPNSRYVNLTAVVVEENPIYYDTVFSINSYKVGYLVYNGFMSNYDIQLNQVFSDFKAAGINKLILDLRYNGGGSVTTATNLASMIYGTYTNRIFYKIQYNAYLQNLYQTYSPNDLIAEFTNVILPNNQNSQTPINTLNLNQVYIITTRNTASASELIINGLRAYIPVITIGDTTYGKYVASKTIKDEDANHKVNPNHKWALQPIIVKLSNANDVSDFVNGLAPTVFAKEDIANLLPFGNANEPMLKVALDYIKGVPQTASVLKSTSMGLRKIADSKDFIPHSKEMYFNDKFLKKLPLKKPEF